MSYIPSDCIIDICKYLCLSDILQIRIVNRHWRNSITNNKNFFSQILKSQFLSESLHKFLQISSDDSFRLLCSYARHFRKGLWKDVQSNILFASSCDRWEETPLNLLTHDGSKCFRRCPKESSGYITLSVAQLMCQCAFGSPCYWSSAPSIDENSCENVVIQCSRFCLVVGVVIRPYQATWHPGSPVYGPKEVIVEFLEPNSNSPTIYPELPSRKNRRTTFLSNFRSATDEQVYYRTAPFTIPHRRGAFLLSLPTPQILLGGKIRLIFVGKHQRQPIGDDDSYYLCLNPCDIYGIPLDDDIVQEESRISEECDYFSVRGVDLHTSRLIGIPGEAFTTPEFLL